MSNTLERLVVEQAMQTLRDGWVQYCGALNANGKEVAWYSKGAVGFCAEAAIMRALRDIVGHYGPKERKLAD